MILLFHLVILGQKMEEELGLMHVDLDGRFSTVRTKESNLGNNFLSSLVFFLEIIWVCCHCIVSSFMSLTGRRDVI